MEINILFSRISEACSLLPRLGLKGKISCSGELAVRTKGAEVCRHPSCFYLTIDLRGGEGEGANKSLF